MTETPLPASIRPLEPADLSNGLIGVLAALAPADLPEAELAAILAERTRQGWVTFVADAGGRVVGTASLLVERKFIHRVGYLEDVAVCPGWRGKGLGLALVRHAGEAARRAGCYKVVLHCRPELHTFYARAGFRPHDSGLRLDLP
jgi:predicted N-acetyltransferase YhbS